MARDQIYVNHEATAGSFEFNEAVAEVFPDMLRRSVPGYDASIQAIGALAASHVTSGTRCYDLGCSLGAASIAMRDNIAVPDCSVIAVDTAPAMVAKCRQLVGEGGAGPPISVIEADVRGLEIDNASMVVMNYTLQFLPPDERTDMIRKIHSGLIDGGVFVLSEKVANDDPLIEQMLVDLHHDFKRANAYSDLEISRKRTSLENVLIAETTESHLRRLGDAGFAHASVWLKHFNFVSIVAIRQPW